MNVILRNKRTTRPAADLSLEHLQSLRETSPSSGNRLPARWLLLILLLAFVLRLSWLYSHAFVIENEGAEYVRIAQNLHAGNGYQGTMGGPQLLFPPFYPLLILCFSYLTRNFESAARLVSLLSGSLLIVPLMLLAYRHYGKCTAVLVGLLTACYLPLVMLSTTTFSECVYTTLLVGGVYTAFRSVQFGGNRYYLLTGIFFGLAYLTRPEALAYPFVIVLALFFLARRRHVDWNTPLRAALLVCVCVAALAAPYIFYLRQHTGHWRLEGKSEVNYALGLRLNSGMSGGQAALGLGPQGEEEGPLLDPNSWIGHRGYPRNPLVMLHYIKASASNNLHSLLYSQLSPLLVIPLLLLGTLGLFRTSWCTERTERELFLLLMVALAAIPVAVGPQFSEHRFILPLLPFALLWAAEGLREFAEWGVSSFARGATSSAEMIRPAILLCGGVVLVSSAALTLGQASIFREQGTQRLGLKKAGIWLRAQGPEPKRVMSAGTVIPYYSGAIWIPAPYAEPPLVLNYLRRTKSNFVVLNDFGYHGPGDLQALLTATGADLIYDAGRNARPRILIYHLDGEKMAHQAEQGSRSH